MNFRLFIIKDEFVQYIEITRSMGYEEEPDYKGLKELFKKIMERSGYVDDKQFDWVIKKNSNQTSNLSNVNLLKYNLLIFIEK